MPRVSYAKAIDWYLIGSFMFVFSTLVTDLLIYRFSRSADSKRLDGKNGKEVGVIPVAAGVSSFT